MSRSEPQITEIASHLATKLPTPGAKKEEAVQAWRHTLRYARRSEVIDTLTEMIAEDAGDDPVTARYCEELRSR